MDSTASLFHVTTSEPPEESINIIREVQQQSGAGGGGPPISPSYLTAENSPSSVTGVGGDGDPGGSRSGSISSCSSSTSSSPSKYRTYVVKANDTVTSIAASFDCTPSELMRVNRLITARYFKQKKRKPCFKLVIGKLSNQSSKALLFVLSYFVESCSQVKC